MPLPHIPAPTGTSGLQRMLVECIYILIVHAYHIALCLREVQTRFFWSNALQLRQTVAQWGVLDGTEAKGAASHRWHLAMGFCAATTQSQVTENDISQPALGRCVWGGGGGGGYYSKKKKVLHEGPT